MVFAPNMAVCSVHFPSTDNQWISVFDPCFCAISREMIPKPKERGKVCFMGFAIKTFSLVSNKNQRSERKTSLPFTQKFSQKYPSAHVVRKECADGYFLFRFLNDCSRGLLSELPWACMVVNMSYRFYKTPTPYRVFYGRFKRTQMDKRYVICFG